MGTYSEGSTVVLAKRGDDPEWGTDHHDHSRDKEHCEHLLVKLQRLSGEALQKLIVQGLAAHDEEPYCETLHELLQSAIRYKCVLE